jgi:uncharacterized RDD family membrane protein YckC
MNATSTSEGGRRFVPFVGVGLIILAMSGLVSDSYFGSRSAATNVLWVIIAGSLAAGALAGSKRPALWGLVAGSAAIGAAALIGEVGAIARYDGLGHLYKNKALISRLVLLAVLAACVVVALSKRWARSPLTEVRLVRPLMIAGAAVVFGMLIPGSIGGGESASFEEWNLFTSPGIDTLAWFISVGALAWCLVFAVHDRSFWGRCVAVGAATPVVLNVVMNQFLDGESGSQFFLYRSQRGSVVLLLACVAEVVLLVLAHRSATESVTDLPSATPPSAFSPVTSSVAAQTGGVFTPQYGSGMVMASGAPVVYASVGARFGGMLIDGLASTAMLIPGYAILVGAANASNGGGAGFGLLALVAGSLFYLVIYCRRVGRIGQSWGHQACGVRVVDAHTGGPIGAGRAFGRLIVRGLAAMPCYLGLLWACWDPQKRGWHDMAVGTVVVPASAPFGSSPALPLAAAPPPPPLAARPLPSPAPPASAPSAISASLFAAPAVSRGAALEFDDGGRTVFDRTVLVGRDPTAVANEPGALLVGIDDPTMSVSKTHLALGIDGDQMWAEDRHSTNGVMITTATGEQLRLVAGRRARIEIGARLEFGDRWLKVVAR